jgi:hypothetical protein
MISKTISLLPGVSWNRGKHSIHFGPDLRDRRINPSSASALRAGGQFDFNRDTTTQFPGIQQATSGSVLPRFCSVLRAVALSRSRRAWLTGRHSTLSTFTTTSGLPRL